MDLGNGDRSANAAVAARRSRWVELTPPATGADDLRRPSASERAAALDAVNHTPRIRLGWLWEWAKIFPVAVVLFFGVRTFLVEAYKIPSGSMERTLLVGDFLLVNKLVYGAEVPLHGRAAPAHPRIRCAATSWSSSGPPTRARTS